MTRAVFFAIAGTLLACSSAPAQNGADVAARIGDRAVTVKELDDRWRATDAADQIETVQKLYDGRRNALELIVADMLLPGGEGEAEPGRLRRVWDQQARGRSPTPTW
jgi:hypothetical protein